MLSIVLLAVLLNIDTGEVTSVRTLGFESMEQCKQATDKLRNMDLPREYKVYLDCVDPNAVKI